MSKLGIVLVIAGSVGVLAGYLRLITDSDGKIPLNRWRFTGCLPAFLVGLWVGTRDLIIRRRTDESDGAVLVIAGIAVAGLGIWAVRP